MSPTTSSISSPEGYQDRRRSSPSLQGTQNGRVQKHHRRLSSTGGGRAWTEEEEAYLLRTRLHKMPYKHIAAHLGKTELACRLHYHQMSYGTNRRKRTASVSSTASSSYKPLLSSSEASREQTPYTYLNPVASPASSPEPVVNKPMPGFSDPSQQPRSHVPILPKPNTSSINSFHSTPPDLNKSPRLDTSFTDSQKYCHYPRYHQHIDPERLRALYESHSGSFWSLLASEYSHNSQFSGPQLEDAFFRTVFPSESARPRSPPTPGLSPQDTACAASFSAPAVPASENRGFQAINGPAPTPTSNLNSSVSAPSPMERCSVSALLTVEKDVRAPRSKEVTA